MSDISAILTRASMRGFEARHGLERFAVNLCSALGLPQVSVEWTDGTITAAMSSGGMMYLADIADDARVTRGTVAKYAGFIVHELLHRKYTDFNVNDQRHYVRSLHNAIEDAWIERKAIGSSLTGNVSGLLHSLLRGMVDEAMGQVQDWADPQQLPFSLAVFCRGYGFTVPVPGSLLPAWEEASRRVDACQSSTDTLEVARWVYEQIKADDGQQQNQQQNQQQADDGKEGQQEGQQSTPGQGEGEDGQESQDGDEGQGKPADAGPLKAKPKDSMRAMEVEPRIDADETAPGGSYSGAEVLSNRPPAVFRRSVWGADARVPARLRHQVRLMFENSAREWREGGFKSGTLHRPALCRVPTGAAEVFARRMSEDGVDSAVVILLDISGSMYPTAVAHVRSMDTDAFNATLGSQVKASKISVAVGSCIVLMDTLAQAGAQTMVMTFGEESRIVKTWGQQWRKVAPVLEALEPEGNTNDYAAMRFATEALMRHPAERKVIISITDGQGEVYRTGAQVKAAQALGVRVIGIGIDEVVTETYGPESVTINKVDDLGTVAFNRLKAAA